ncbi:tRNA threonylcarbamoyladenosine biosynthesis protein TsaB [Evansella vedderi]|uniref:tRNA threonylcarbamoyladenosine biosynthesis protein TsaB n=1 Tax=Evansella vedderi TaxID=38282 RepID=A0ABT9ZTJ1_9BACI|nr:tRNA (adenosine(37)-N6)-threonylcarbamoyltransferase complex dimerization subunit type 1 TsaB [Evansella vedderi]MDQ0254169.1 tRNA threonylcarbamoyladenosine biosynthesis protein TsaB [Evansella vedderi]
MNGLAIDTSTYVLGVAVIKDGEVAGEIITNIKKNHSVRLMTAIRTLLEEVEIKPQDLDKIIVTEGPGSYTGVRIGVTTGKTLAWSLKIPIVGVSSLEVLAQNGYYFDGFISPFIDARRGQVYTGLYGMENGVFKNIKEDRIVLHKDWLEELKSSGKQVLFLSTDMDKHKQEIKEILGYKAQFPFITGNLLRPSELARLGMKKETEVKDIHTFTPNYIRLAEAEAKWLANQKDQ